MRCARDTIHRPVHIAGDLLGLRVLGESGGRCLRRCLTLGQLRLVRLLQTSNDPLTFRLQFGVSWQGRVSDLPDEHPQLRFFWIGSIKLSSLMVKVARRIGTRVGVDWEMRFRA